MFAFLHPWGNFGSPLKRSSYASQGWAQARESRNDIHRGMDMRAAVGDPAYAVGSGTVVTAAYSSTAGNYVAIQHSGGLITRYLHLSVIDVKQGQRVSKGQLIGRTGNTGNSAGPHLHFDALLDTQDQLNTYRSLFGEPRGGFSKGSLGYKVPVEPLIPVDSYSAIVQKGAADYGLKLRGGKPSVFLLAALAGGGYWAYRTWKKGR
jgi:murein DD-endopeptidase MepM/ murein hydrolase activator NlpD